MSKSKDLFAEKLYDTLRSYDNGEFDNYGVAVGKLTPPLTQVFDRVRSFADDYVLEVGNETGQVSLEEAREKYCHRLEYHGEKHIAYEKGFTDGWNVAKVRR